jgi:signal transduction histidine kinase
MRPRLVAAFLFAVLAPIVALAWLGIRLVSEESEVVRHRFDEMARSELAAVDVVIGRVVTRWERRFDAALGSDATGAAAWREVSRRERGVRQVFVLDHRGWMVHPPPDGPRTSAEDEFLDRTRAIWDARESLVRPADAPGGPAPRGPSTPFTPSAAKDSGWYPWYWGPGLNLLWWKRDAAGRVVGVEADRTAMIADIVGELPATDPFDADAFGGRIRLVDANGATVYAWGTRDPDEPETPLVVRDLGPPLGSWRLEYFPASGALETAFGRSAMVGVLGGVGAMVLVVLALAGYFLHAGGREIREARQRVTFVNQVSHELKTPLTNIRMYAELLDDRMVEEDETARAYVGVIVSESQRLSRLIANVLSLARQGRGQLAARPSPVRVDDAVADVLARFRPHLLSRGVGIAFSPGATPAEVLLDADAMGQILGNLLGNVEKYAASGGRVDVATASEGDTTVVDVADRGPGIPAWARERVFKPFFRLSNRVTEGVAGTGIGLSIARDLARLHGGDLVLLPGGPGASFRLTLHTPRADAGAAMPGPGEGGPA